MRLQRLTGLERDKIVAEYDEVLELIEHLEKVLASEEMVSEIIVEELTEIKERFGDERRTEIIDDPSEISIEDLIAEEEMVITVSREGYVKRSAALDLPRAAAGRARSPGHGDRRTRTRSGSSSSPRPTPPCSSSPRPAGSSLARSTSCPTSAPPPRGRALVNLLSAGAGRTGRTLLAVRDFDEHEDALPFVRDPQGPGQTDPAGGLRQHPRQRAPGGGHQRGRRPALGPADRRQQPRLHGHPPGQGDPLRGNRRAAHGPGRPPAFAASICATATRSRRSRSSIPEDDNDILVVTDRGLWQADARSPSSVSSAAAATASP